MSARQVIIWGAGKIGRGFVAEAFSQGDYDMTFVDIDAELVKSLKSRRDYLLVKAATEGVEEKTISAFSALHTSETEAIRARLMTENPIVEGALLKGDLPVFAAQLAPLIAERARKMPDSPMDVIMSVNMRDPDRDVRAFLERELASDPEAFAYLRDKVGVVATIVLCISPSAPEQYKSRDALAAYTNGFPELTVGRKGLKCPPPASPMIRLSDNIEAEETRKLYTMNLTHATAAYLGAPRGITYMRDAARDPFVRGALEEAMAESCFGIGAEYGFANMDKWGRMILGLAENPNMWDDLPRLGADSFRKLNRNDRLTGPALLCLAHGGAPKAIARAIRAGLEFDGRDPGCKKTRAIVEARGLSAAIEEVCGLKRDEALYNMILEG